MALLQFVHTISPSDKMALAFSVSVSSSAVIAVKLPVFIFCTLATKSSSCFTWAATTLKCSAGVISPHSASSPFFFKVSVHASNFSCKPFDRASVIFFLSPFARSRIFSFSPLNRVRSVSIVSLLGFLAFPDPAPSSDALDPIGALAMVLPPPGRPKSSVACFRDAAEASVREEAAAGDCERRLE